LENHSHLPLVRRNENTAAWRGERCTVDQNLTVIRLFQSRHKSESRCFAAARWAEQSEDFTRLNGKADPVDRRDRPEALDDIAKLEDRLRHTQS